MVGPRVQPPLFGRPSWPESRRVADILRQETTGGVLLLAAAVAGLAWANSWWSSSYAALRDTVVGPADLHLDLALGTWAADGLLAIFFFVAGLELKRELVDGDLRDPRRAILPVAAAIGGMVLPALVYLAVNLARAGGDLRGWAVPTATDIAFALAVLAVVSSHLPTSLRTFLLTLAVVDDLLAIGVIAVVFTDDLSIGPLALAVLPLAAFATLLRRAARAWWLLLPLAITCWALVHESGVHATVAGVLLALVVPVDKTGLAERIEHRWRLLSAGVAVPVFAFFAAGVGVGGRDGLLAAAGDAITLGVVAGLVAGKALGVLAATYLVARFTRARLADDLAWTDVLGVSLLSGIGFTVSLLIGELAFGAGSPADGSAKVGVLAGSLLAGLLATVVLRLRNRVYRRIWEAERVDADRDGQPDLYEPVTGQPKA